MIHPDQRAVWRKSTYSAVQGNCIEVADGFADIVPVRDSKAHSGPALVFRGDPRAAYVTDVKAGELPSV
ncbi:DUF397 domain-containing protein [Kitasatospora sp. NPDC093558]|uniref:DUF397 domain-containing protein n=1 Tax=Kitasatospora sp. NPDC093558 TaxID=3155201 RepID=UPI0034485B8A